MQLRVLELNKVDFDLKVSPVKYQADPFGPKSIGLILTGGSMHNFMPIKNIQTLVGKVYSHSTSLKKKICATHIFCGTTENQISKIRTYIRCLQGWKNQLLGILWSSQSQALKTLANAEANRSLQSDVNQTKRTAIIFVLTAVTDPFKLDLSL